MTGRLCVAVWGNRQGDYSIHVIRKSAVLGVESWSAPRGGTCSVQTGTALRAYVTRRMEQALGLVGIGLGAEELRTGRALS